MSVDYLHITHFLQVTTIPDRCPTEGSSYDLLFNLIKRESPPRTVGTGTPEA